MKKLFLLLCILLLSISSASAYSLYSTADITNEVKNTIKYKNSVYPYLNQDLSIYEKSEIKKIVNKYMDLYSSALNSTKSEDWKQKDLELVSREFYKAISKYQKEDNINLYAWINVSCNYIYSSSCTWKRSVILSDLTPSELEFDLAYTEHKTLINDTLKESILLKLNKIKSAQKEVLLRQLIVRIKTIATSSEDYTKRFLYLDLANIIDWYLNEAYPTTKTTEDLINGAIN